MPRRTGLILCFLALIIAISLFAYNVYSSMHLSSTTGSELNTNACGTRCTAVPTEQPATPAITPTPTYQAIPGYNLAWDDEFNGTQLDPGRWYAVNSLGDNQQQGCCLSYSYSSLITPDQLRVHDGMLTISTARSNTAGYAYKTGAITTETLSDTPTFTFTYGRIDIRAKLPGGRGVWPAMWLVTAPATVQVSYEIDMMEMLGEDPHTLYQVVHHAEGKEYCMDQGPDYSQALHIFTLDWEPGKLTWSVDGQTVCTVTRYVPSQPMYLIVNTAMSDGSWGELANSSTPLPQTFDIDYVRIYKHT